MKKKKILLVDDEVDLTKFLKINLEQSGEFEVEIANTGKRGIELAKEIHPDLIFLDILMPEINGGLVAETLHNDQSTKDIPIVFLTALAKKEELGAKEGKIGSYHILAKPVTAEQIMAYIRNFLKSG